MGIDKKTTPTYFNIWMTDNQQFLNTLRKAFEAEMGKDAKDKQLVLNTMNGFAFEPTELYFEDNDGKAEINCSFELLGVDGRASVSLCIPLSDILLIDILQHAAKKLNKLKVAMESLK